MFQVTSRYFVSKAVRITTPHRVVMRPETPASHKQAMLPKIRLLAACLVHKKILEIVWL